MHAFSDVSAAVLAVIVLAMLTTTVAARISGRISVVDVTWGLALTAVAVVCALFDSSWRGWLLAGLVGIWGLRLSWHIFRRDYGHGEDPRYTELLGSGRGGPLIRVWIPQGGAIWLVSLPVQVSAVAGGGVTAVVVAGVLLWAIGVFFEAVGDAQLASYKKDPGRHPVLDRGLWRYTRHPNYFGDASVWWGIFLISASAWPGVLTIVAPIAMTYFLVFATGARLLERSMMRRPGYRAYAERTSMFLPRPPRSGPENVGGRV
jgi:steroid 5-alpha reductase family enzyme